MEEIDLVKLLPASEKETDHDWTAKLLKAIISKDIKEISQSMKNKIDINKKDEEGRNAIMYCLKFLEGASCNDVILKLLNLGANINDQDKEGKTALMQAIEQNNISATKFLIKHKADINIKNNNKETAMDIAKRLGLSNIIQMMQALINQKSSNAEEKE